MRGASFAWSSDEVLRDLTLSISPGELVGVVGRVGAGKSSLLAAILGEMKVTGGVRGVAGDQTRGVALVSQQAWIQNMTIRQNIIFGKPFNR